MFSRRSTLLGMLTAALASATSRVSAIPRLLQRQYVVEMQPACGIGGPMAQIIDPPTEMSDYLRGLLKPKVVGVWSERQDIKGIIDKNTDEFRKLNKWAS